MFDLNLPGFNVLVDHIDPPQPWTFKRSAISPLIWKSLTRKNGLLSSKEESTLKVRFHRRISVSKINPVLSFEWPATYSESRILTFGLIFMHSSAMRKPDF